MRRLFWSALPVAGLCASFGCNAQVTESCIGGECTLGAGGWPGYGSTSASSSSASSSSSGGPLDAKNCPVVPKTGDYPCTGTTSVWSVVHGVCHKCHVMPPKNGAPFSLLTYDDTQKPYAGLFGTSCTKDSDCGPSAGTCVQSACNGLRFQQMFISIGPTGCPRMPFGENPLVDPEYSTLRDWLGACAPPAPAGTGCGCPGNGCN